jgi:hypothetical protein
VRSGENGLRAVRIAAGLLVCLAAGALSSIALARSGNSGAAAAYYYYCPGGGAGSNYGYCPPTTTTTTTPPSVATTLDLEPETDTNVVDEQHCVTATVRNQFGDPMQGVIVDFTATPPASPMTGSGTTNSQGEVEFCFTSALPGAIDVEAHVRSNPTAQDEVKKFYVLPPSTVGCKFTDGGRITALNGDKATFGSVAKVSEAKVTGTDKVSGTQQYQDHGPAANLNVHSITILAVSCTGNSASIFGKARINGAGSFDFRVDLTDNGEPGIGQDTYRIRVNGYDSGERVLEGGNVKKH